METNQSKQTNPSDQTNPINRLLIVVIIFLVIGIVWLLIKAQNAGPTVDSKFLPVEDLVVTKFKEAREVDLTWEKTDQDSGYLILLEDVTDSTNISKWESFRTNDPEFKLKYLLPNSIYNIHLFRQLPIPMSDTSMGGNKEQYSAPTTYKLETTDWVIIEDVLHFESRPSDSSRIINNPKCLDFDACSTVNLNGGNRFDWVADNHYIVRISDGSTRVVAYIEKDFSDPSAKKVKSHINLYCDGWMDVNAPKKDFCPAGSPSDKFCGPSGSTITYSILPTETGCTIEVTSVGATISVESCK